MSTNQTITQADVIDLTTDEDDTHLRLPSMRSQRDVILPVPVSAGQRRTTSRRIHPPTAPPENVEVIDVDSLSDGNTFGQLFAPRTRPDHRLRSERVPSPGHLLVDLDATANNEDEYLNLDDDNALEFLYSRTAHPSARSGFGSMAHVARMLTRVHSRSQQRPPRHPANTGMSSVSCLNEQKP